jgi:hypothetical protein
MDIALIPPIPELEGFGTSAKCPNTHLLLSHLLSSKAYEDYYIERSEMGDYLILDNSAHEHGQGVAVEALLKQAMRLHCQEIVVPDVLFDARGTVESARRALEWMETTKGKRLYNAAHRPRLMFVPQGDKRPEWGWCLKQLMQLHDLYDESLCLGTPVIGISKDYYYWHGGLSRLVDDYLLPYRMTQRIQVHCLGWPTDLWALAQVARHHPWVRSTDSAKPFVYAKNNILLEPGGKVPEYPRRDERYFEDPLNEEQRHLARRNVEVFLAAANDQLILATAA